MSSVVDDLALIGRMRFRKARALLFYLHHLPGLDHRGEKIADIFWQDFPHKKAMASLRQAIRQIREAIEQTPHTVLETQRGQLGLRCQGNRTLDLRIQDLLSAPFWQESTTDTVERYVQEFDLMSGLSDSYDSWLAIKRNQAVQEIAELLEAIFQDSRGTERAVQAAKLARSIEPSNESAVRFLMYSDWAQGSGSRAIDTYNNLYKYLEQELDQEPEAETLALAAKIKSGPYDVSVADTATTASRKIRPSLSLEKVQRSALSVADDSLLSVLYSDLRMRMSRFREWSVVDDVAHAAPDLVLRLDMHSFDGECNLIVELSAPAANQLVWSEVIQSPAKNWDQKARAQLANISRALSFAARSGEGMPHASAIYDRWLQSQTLIDTWSPKTEARAIEMLNEITAEAPRFGPAHAELAGALNVRHILLPGTQHTEGQKQLALHHAIEAVNLDPLDTRAHRVLGWCYCHKGEFELADFHFDQAIELNKSNNLTLISAALGYAFAGRLDQSERVATDIGRTTEALEPFHFVYLAAANYLCGNFEEAARQCELAGDLMATVGGWHTASLVQLGRRQEARARLQAYHHFMKSQWTLKSEPTCAETVDWFTSCFPMRDEQAREHLRLTVLKAL